MKSFKFVGDNTGYLHVGPNQLITAQIANHDHFGINVYVHKDGHMSFPPKFTCYDISLTVRFVWDYSQVSIRNLFHVCNYLASVQTILSIAKESQREFFGGSILSSFWTQASKCHL